MGERRCLVRGSDGRVQEVATPSADRLAAEKADPGSLLWLDLTDPGPVELDLLRDGFGLHPLAMEDIENRRQRAKVDTYPGEYVIVTYEARIAPRRTGDRQEELAEIHLLVAPGALVSVHWGSSAAVSEVERLFTTGTPGAHESVGALLYTLLDTIADGYLPVLDELSDAIDGIEERIVGGERQADALRDVLHVKRRLLELRRVVAPFRDVANALLRRELKVVDAATLPYYQDLYDHLVRALDSIDLYRDTLASALDANLAIASNSLNLVVKRLTALTVILMLPTLIAGIYGMNFTGMPELEWSLGYPFALGLMLLAILGAVAFFRWRDWL